MGRKLSRASLKIYKTDKKQLSSLIKILRPKVYVTDSSNFIKLVQEPTDNANTSSCPSPEPVPPEKATAFDVQGQGEPESSINTFDASFEQSESRSQVFSSHELSQSSNHNYPDHTTSDDHIYLHEIISTTFSIYQEADMLAFQDLECLLVDVNQSPMCSSDSELYIRSISVYMITRCLEYYKVYSVVEGNCSSSVYQKK